MSTVAEDVNTYIGVNSEEYIVLGDGEQLQDINQQNGNNLIVLANDEQIFQSISATGERKNVVITEDGQMLLVDEIHEIIDDDSRQSFLFQKIESENDEIAEKSPAVLDRELEEKRKRLNLPKVPKKFLLFDNICAEIVDYDEEDGAPYVEFSMAADDGESERLPVECGICPDIMHRSKLDAHLKTHIRNGSKRYTCIYCEEDFVTRAYAAGHARRHMGIRPYVCIPCKMYYCTKQDLKVHEQRRHLAKEHICEQCGKTFAQNTSLKHHRLLVHEQRRNYKCEHCGKRFLRKYAMTEHVRSVHYGDRRLLDCPFCRMHFRDTHKLAQHRKEMHLNQSSFDCRACGLKFNHIYFFDAHRRSLQCREKLKSTLEQVEHDENDEQQQQQEQKDGLMKTDHQEQEIIVEEIFHNDIENGTGDESREEKFAESISLNCDDENKYKIEEQLLYEITAIDDD